MQTLRISTVLSFLGALAVAVAAMLYFGADANYDLQNYHLYNPYALLDGRLDLDQFPSLQAYINPTLDIPFYLALVHLGVLPAHALLALYQALFIWVVFLFNRHLFRMVLPDTGLGIVLVLAVAATVVGVTGAAGIGQAITTFNEIPTSLLVIAGLGLVLPDAAGRLPPVRRIALAGLLMGLATGLKLTAMVYLVAACITLLPWRFRGQEFRALLVYGLTAALGILVAHGVWGSILYRHFGNPVFPFFNAIFHSPWEAPKNFVDGRFFPETALGYLTYPLEWAFTLSTEVGEIPLNDPRLALLIVAAIALVIIHFTLWRLPRAALFVIVFAVSAYVVWLLRFSILRYAVPVEVMSGTLLVLVIAALFRAEIIPAAGATTLAATAVAAVVAVTHPPNWGRVPFSEGYKVAMRPIPEGATVLLVGQPISYLVPLLPGGNRRFIGVNWWSSAEGPRREAAIDALSRATGTAFALILRGTGGEASVEQLGWRIEEDGCTPVRSSFHRRGIDLCPIVPSGSGT